MGAIEHLKEPFLPLITSVGKALEKSSFHEEPIFIGGCGRSGTTLLLSMLSAHPDIFAVPRELGLFNHTHRDEQGDLVVDRIDRLYRTFLLNRIPREATRWCEKSPSNIHHFDEIDEYCEGKFKFIEVLRDGRDVVLSQHPTAPERYWVDPARWVRDVSAGMEHRGDPRVFTVRYEDLIRDYDDTMRRICEFLGISFSAELRDWHENTTVRKNSAYFTKVAKSHANSIEKWKRINDTDRIREFISHPRAKALLSANGYPV